MKKILLVYTFLLFCFISARAQDGSLPFNKDENSGDSYYEEVVTLPNVNQADLFKRAKSWILANMKTVDNNIIFDEKEYSIVNSAAIKVDPKNFFNHGICDGSMDFKFHVWVRDGRYRFRIDNITYNLLTGRGHNLMTNDWENKSTNSEVYSELGDNKYGSYLKAQAAQKLYIVATVFKKAMTIEAKEDKKDW